ncbi:MAG: GtrA family protein [Paracoccaceae bacterium]
MIERLRARPDLWRFVKFLFVGVLNTIFGFAAYALFLKLLHFPPQVALALSYVLGVLWNYGTHARIVFKSQGFRRLPIYAGAYGVLYVLNAGALSLVLKSGLAPLGAQAVLVLPMAMLAFVLISLVLTGRLPFMGGRQGR